MGAYAFSCLAWWVVFSTLQAVVSVPFPPTPTIWGHRGTTVKWPENTMPAFVYAAQSGADGWETDLRLTQDGEVVLLHDATLDRTTNCTGLLRDYPWASLQHSCDACAWFNPTLSCHLPLLSDAIALALAWNKTVILHLKEEGLQDAVARVLGRFPPRAKMAVVASCQSQPQALNFSARLPSVVRQRVNTQWALPELTPPGFFEAEILYGIRGYSLSVEAVRPAFVRQAHRHMLPVLSWVVNSEEEIVDMLRVGVDGLISDDPQAAVDLVTQIQQKCYQ